MQYIHDNRFLIEEYGRIIPGTDNFFVFIDKMAIFTVNIGFFCANCSVYFGIT